eukprot:gnl/MRDRNA2_/MRDRNA2_34348_c0_seq1.p1 gnl/MRDRNA2_/MRDRNA2_34348_c0~~gnl/MRDRNA2_/MRDRNA2_34348_c0_seq1.p1  ORF type:complete len:368 (-),score=55.63 gnl/MRDRNA2_/MRDRNA2_34348_c0_seq1:139-1113(-)
MDSMVSMLRDIKSGADNDNPDGLIPDGPLRDDFLNATMTTVHTDCSATDGAASQNEPDAALNAISPEPQASEASLNNSSARRLHSGLGNGRVPLGPVLQQGGQRVGEIPRQQQLGNRGNDGHVLVGDRVDGTWEVRVTIQPPQDSVDGRSRGSASARDHNRSQQSWTSVCKSATPRKARRPVHVVHRHHHHHYHHHYFPVEGDKIPEGAFVNDSGEQVPGVQSSSSMQQGQGGRFAPSSSPSATPPTGHDSSEHRHFHYHHHAQSLGIPGHAQKLLAASDQKQSEAENARGTSPIPLSRSGGLDTDGTQHHLANMPGTRLPSLI